MEVLNVLIGIVILVVAVWVAIFGGIGMLLSSSRGSSGLNGFVWGTFLGPLGWVAILWLTRGSSMFKRAETAPPLASKSTWPPADPWDD